MRTFVIAEAGSSHDNDISKAFRLIEAAKACDASAVKFQWTSNSYAMAVRRSLGQAAADIYGKYLQKPIDWLNALYQRCQQVGIEFMCSTFLIEDIATIAPFVKRFKISAFESGWAEFIHAHEEFRKEAVISTNSTKALADRLYYSPTRVMYCVSKYPCALEDLHLEELRYRGFYDGFSDHSVSLQTGAQAVSTLGHEPRYIEKHIKLWSTDRDNPDYPHSLYANLADDRDGGRVCTSDFAQYVRNIREVERCM